MCSAHQVRGPLGVAPLRRAQDRRVLGHRPLHVAAQRQRAHPVAAHLAEAGGRAPATCRCPTPRAGEPWNAMFASKNRLTSFRSACCAIVSVSRCSSLEVLLAQPRHGQPHRHRLERLAHLVQLEELLLRERANDRAATRPDGDEPLGGEPADRLADRAAADAELLGERDLRQLGCRARAPRRGSPRAGARGRAARASGSRAVPGDSRLLRPRHCIQSPAWIELRPSGLVNSLQGDPTSESDAARQDVSYGAIGSIRRDERSASDAHAAYVERGSSWPLRRSAYSLQAPPMQPAALAGGEGHEGRVRLAGEGQRLRLEPAGLQRREGGRRGQRALSSRRSRTSATTRPMSILRQLITGGANFIVAHASGYDTIATRLAQQYKVPMITYDVPTNLNKGLVSYITTSSQEGAYLAGILAAKTTKTAQGRHRHLGRRRQLVQDERRVRGGLPQRRQERRRSSSRQ